VSRRIFVPQIKKIDSVETLVQLVKSIKGPFYFRGQPVVTLSLKPTIGRTGYWFNDAKRDKPFTLEDEKNLLHRFKRYAYEFGEKILEDWGAISLARHHGVPVRLLDWTSNPLVALYWAAKKQREDDPLAKEDGVIWGFKPRIRGDIIDVTKKPNTHPFSVKGIRIVYPLFLPRLNAQSAFFTIHEDPYFDLENLKDNKYPKKHNDMTEGKKWLVCSKKKKEIVETLHRLGINERTLFPGLDGIGRDILNKELMFPIR